jgi:MIP family channel proteins
MHTPRLASVLTAEALGTFLFLFVGMGAVVLNTGAGAADGGLLGVALAHGLALAVLVSALGAVSGAHFNPAVTVAVFVSGRITAQHAAMYIAVQLAAGVAAALALRAVFPEAAWGPVALGTPAVHAAITIPSAIAIEAVLTVLLVIAVFGTAIDRRAPKLGGLAIGLAVVADILMAGPLTGAAMNPARWFGPAVASGTFDNWYVWWVGPFIGAAVAAFIYRFALAEAAYAEVTPATPEGIDADLSLQDEGEPT